MELHIYKNELHFCMPRQHPAAAEPELWLGELKLLSLPFPKAVAAPEARYHFSYPLSRRMKRFIEHPSQLHIRVNGLAITASINEQVIWKQQNRLPAAYLEDLYHAAWCFNHKGQLHHPADQSLSTLPLKLKMSANAKGFTRFTLTASGDSALRYLHQNIGIFVDHYKVSVASIQLNSQKDQSIKATFIINNTLVYAIAKRHELRLLLDDEFYRIPAKLLLWLYSDEQKVQTLPADYLENIQQGFQLNSKGVLIKPKDENPLWLEHTLKLYQRAQQYFREKYQYELYLTGGTLLGYARSGGVISFDKDFDSGYLSKHTEPDAIKAEFKHIILDLLQSGEDIRLITRVGKKFRCDYFMWFDKSGCHIDVFPGAIINKQYRRPTFVFTELNHDDFQPFVAARFNGYDVMVPRHYEKKVEAVYGPGWRSPDPFWKKVKSERIIQYRQQIMLNQQDFLEIAKYSRAEGEQMQRAITNNSFSIQF